jgi:DNA-binding NarL/FixJ family response regulator
MTDASSNVVRILLADAHAATRAGLRQALAGHPFEIVAEEADADAAIAAALRERPDVCVLDAAMPGGAVAATAAITRSLAGTAVVVLSAIRDDGAMLDAVRAGAAGYLLKDMDPARLRFALIGVTQGEAALPRTLVTRLMLEFRVRDRRRHLAVGAAGATELTQREWEVLALLADGASTATIASLLDVSAVTVRRHVSGVLRKLGVRDRAAAVAALRAAERRNESA